MPKTNIIQIDLLRIDRSRIVHKIRANGQPAAFYNMVEIIEDEEDEGGVISRVFEKLTKAEYDAGKQGTKIGYGQPLKKHV